MKSHLLCLFFFFATTSMAHAQLKIHIKGGINTQDIKPGHLVILDDQSMEEFTLRLEEAKFGYHFGIDFMFKFGNFIVMPEVLFSTSEVHYTFAETNDASLLDQVFKENYNYLDIPLNFGTIFGPLSIFGGPVGHLYVNSSSDLLTISSYSQTFESLTYGWNIGTAIHVGRVGAQVKYEGNFSVFGDHINFYGNNYTLDDHPSRLIASLVIGF